MASPLQSLYHQQSNDVLAAGIALGAEEVLAASPSNNNAENAGNADDAENAEDADNTENAENEGGEGDAEVMKQKEPDAKRQKRQGAKKGSKLNTRSRSFWYSACENFKHGKHKSQAAFLRSEESGDLDPSRDQKAFSRAWNQYKKGELRNIDSKRASRSGSRRQQTESYLVHSTGPPPLPSRPLGVRMLRTTSSPTVVVEVFFDLCCPFSKKMCDTLGEKRVGALDRIRSDPTLSKEVEFVYRNVPQPWHPQSAVMHEAMFAVSCAVEHDPERVAAYIRAAFDSFASFEDLKVKDASRSELHNMCADLAALALGNTEGEAESVRREVLSFLDLSHLTPERPHSGLGEVTQLMKFATRYHRTRGVHVTPTVFIHGIEATDLSSIWTADQWLKKLRGVVGSGGAGTCLDI